MEKILDFVDPETDIGIFTPPEEERASKVDRRGWVLCGKHAISERSRLRYYLCELLQYRKTIDCFLYGA